MRSRIPHILAAFRSAVLALEPSKYDVIEEFLEFRAAGGEYTPAELEAKGISAASSRPTARTAGDVAVLPLFGVIAKHAGMEMEISGGTSTDAFGRAFDDAMANASVGTIVIDCHSPGGSVEGVPELAAKIRNAKGQGKKIVAVANAQMNSAAYWICSQADEIIATPSASVGSIGVFTMHTDTSAAEEKVGVKRTVISAGRYKGEAAPGVPLTDDARAALQSLVSECYGNFVADVAKGRGVSVADVKGGFGEGRSISAKQAQAAGMVDRIGTLDETLSKLAKGGGSIRIAATDDKPALAATSETPLIAGDGSPSAIAALTEIVKEAVARGASPAVSALPATEPALQARSHTMSDQDTAAQRAALEKEVRAAESARQKEIRALCAEHKVSDELLASLIDSGADINAASREILKAKRTETAASVRPIQNGGSVTLKLRAEDDPRRGFNSHRDFMLSVMANSGLRARADVSDERLRPLALADKEDKQAGGEIAYLLPQAFTPGSLRAAAGSDEQGGYADRFGGFAVPVQTMPGMLQVNFEGDPTAGLTQSVPMAAPQVEFLARTDKDHTTSVSGGFTVSRRAETTAATASRAEMEKVTLKATSLFGLAYATEEILADSPISFAAIIDNGFRDQFPAHILNEKIRGNGGAEFLGVKNSPAKISISKESGQAADTIVYNNVIKMAARSWGFGQSVWMANHDTRPQLSVLQIPVGVGGSLIYQPSPSVGFPDMLLGRPVFYNEYCDTVGDEGDLMLVNWSQYLEGTYQPLQSAESVHVRFVNHERAFKLWVRNAGAPWWRAAFTPAKSTATLSPIVTLAARA